MSNVSASPPWKKRIMLPESSGWKREKEMLASVCAAALVGVTAKWSKALSTRNNLITHSSGLHHVERYTACHITLHVIYCSLE